MDPNRPATHKQSSRKGKKAWRKNIDLSEVEQGLEAHREELVTHGETLDAVPQDALFTVDTTGDETIVAKKQIKKLKSQEILDAIKSKSKVSALGVNVKTPGYKKVQGVSKKELDKLMALAGRKVGTTKTKAAVLQQGLVKAASADLWGSEDAVQLPSNIKVSGAVPEELKKKSTTGWSKATVQPDTINRAPLVVKELEQLPHAGKSYNPSVESWKALIDKEYQTEKSNEDKRIALQEYKDRIQHLIDTLDDKEEESDGDDDDEVEEEHNDDEGESARLSINPVVKNKKKTKYQRNKQARHEEQVKLHKDLKDLKEKIKELEKLEEIEKTIRPLSVGKVSKERANKKHKLGTKHSVMEDALEVKLSDELSDSLRKLKPEGNLLYDQVRKLQSSGKIESRVPVKRGRRYQQKITEKWTYKDFK